MKTVRVEMLTLADGVEAFTVVLGATETVTIADALTGSGVTIDDDSVLAPGLLTSGTVTSTVKSQSTTCKGKEKCYPKWWY